MRRHSGKRRSAARSTRRRRWILRLVTGTVAALLAWGAIELVLRAAGTPGYGRSFPAEPRPASPVAAYIEPDAELGWVSNRSMPGVNAQGFRDPRDFAALPPSASHEIRVLVLGDSFVWGVGVDPQQSMPRLLERELGERYLVFNLAAPGWGIDQMYLAYLRYVDQLNPQRVILAFIDDDVDRVLEAWRPWEGLAKPCLVVRRGRLVPRHSSSWWERSANKVLWRSVLLGNLLRQLFLYTDAVPVVRAVFAAMASEAVAHGRKLTIVRIPLRDGRAKRPHHLAVDRFVGSEGVRTVEAIDWMAATESWKERLYLEDGHLSPEGNRLLAQALAHEVLARGAASQRRSSGAVEPELE